MKMGRAFVDRGAEMMKGTPMGLFGAMAKGMMSGMESVTDAGVRMSGGGEAARLGVSKAHASYYRNTLLKNAVFG